ncbi:leucine-rich repeat-containing G-protein coupled receptor 5 isoform X2 [Latimeria chalumnae]|uniref:leucine-rich repeat-containing G-protein coupled receptor 5 isoform X2 n=1 Tax=Latimeria chalumnae TaxID=7897 RepID=UPI00313DA2C1
MHRGCNRLLLLWKLLVLFGGGGAARAGKQQQQHRGCPSCCHCEEDGMLLRVDCSDLGLPAVPANLSVFTSYLDLSMNNITELPQNTLYNLHFLEELRLAGNDLTHIPKGAFAGLFNLKVLMLQNNQLRQVPAEALQHLRNLQSLRLDANHISTVPSNCFEGLTSLRHLWLDDNTLTEIPIPALSSLSSLQAMTLALNKIGHIPDHAFRNLSSLVVLHLHNNRIHSLGKKSFDGLHSLETLDLNYNNLDEFPTAIRTLKHLKELHFFDNPIQLVGKSTFQHLPELRTLSLNGATEITEFPDLTGTTSLESLTLTGAQITSLPKTLCEQLPSLQVLDLSYNLLQDLPSFNGCQKLQKIDLHHNKIGEIRDHVFQQLPALRSLDLSWNKVASIHPNAFSSLPSLLKLDLTSNLLSSLPVLGLNGLTHLKLAGNHALQELISSENFPKIRVIEMPYAYQCCAFASCDNLYKFSNLWDKDENSSTDDFQKRDAGIVQVIDDHDFEDFLLDFEDDPKSHHSVQCSPSPGPFKPCDHLFGSWLIRIGVWTITLVSLTCNVLVAVTVFRSPTFASSVKMLVGLIAAANSFMGFSCGILAFVDAWTFGQFSKFGAWWESGTGCQAAGFLSVFSSEACVFLLTVAALERGLSAQGPVKPEARSSPCNIKMAAACCFTSSLLIAALPLFRVGEYGISPLCLPLPFGGAHTMGFLVSLVLINSLCFLVMTVAYTRLYCKLDKAELENLWDCSLIKHIAWLLFTNCILYCPVAFLSFSSLLNLPFISPEVIKSVLLVIVPLPACLNPLLYLLFNPHFKEDLGLLWKQAPPWRREKRSSLSSVDSEAAEKQSCDSTQALVAFASVGVSRDVSKSMLRPAARQLEEPSRPSAVAFAPCQ